MGFVLIVLSTLMWALDTLIRYPLMGQGMKASQLVLVEHLILSVCMLPAGVGLVKELKKRNFKGLKSFIIIGLIGSAIATLAFTEAFALINPSVVILLQKFQPVVAILLAHKVLGEELKREFLLFAILCLVGAFMMSYQEVISSGTYLGQLWQSGHGEELTAKHFYGLVLTFVAVVGWGASTVFGKRLWSMDFLEGQIMFGRFFLGLCFLLPFYVLRDNSPFISMLTIDSSTYLKIFFMVMVSGLAGMGLYYLGLKKTSARQAALAEMFFPFFALGLNWFFLNATLNPIQMVGGALLLLGSTVIQLKHY